MDHNDLTGLFATLGSFGGIALIIWTSVQAKIAKLRAEAQLQRSLLAPAPRDSVNAELQALRQQVSEMQNTSHQFDISFDAALGRLEERMNRVETKVVAVPMAAPAVSSAQAEEAQPLGRR